NRPSTSALCPALSVQVVTHLATQRARRVLGLGSPCGHRRPKDDMRRDPLRSTHTGCVNDLCSGARGGLVMSIVGGFDVHRRQITFDYVDTDTGRVLRGRIAPACRPVFRRWLAERFAGRTDVE